MDHHDDEILDMATAHSYPMEEEQESSSYVPSSSTDQLERYGRWLCSIPRDDVLVLRETPEYQDFLRAFERLGDAHRRVISMNRSSLSMDESAHPRSNSSSHNNNSNSINGSQHHHNYIPHRFDPPDVPSFFTNTFLQNAADDVVLRIFEFLECHSLIRMALTCSRFRQLSYRSATQRTYEVAISRQLNSVMQLLRATEQIEGVGIGLHDRHVRVPVLLLGRRVLVSDSGDPEMNGIYFCTGTNGNGFVFTKPRVPERRVHRIESRQSSTYPTQMVSTTRVDVREGQEGGGRGGLAIAAAAAPLEIPARDANRMGVGAVGGPMAVDQSPSSRFESEVAQPGQLLRCIIAKRFSNEVRKYIACTRGLHEYLSKAYSLLLAILTEQPSRLFYGTLARKWKRVNWKDPVVARLRMVQWHLEKSHKSFPFGLN